MTDTNKKISQDERLSQFTDQVLKGQMNKPASNPTEELRDLEETILRLHNTLPPSSLEESTKKQMLVRLNARIRREKEQPQKKSFWASLFDTEWMRTQSRPQFAATIGIIAILVVAVIISPTLGDSGSSTTVGTAFNSSSNVFIVIGLITVILGFLWVIRKK
jgi:hypothetical protein